MARGNESRDELIAGLVRVGELELSGDDELEVDATSPPASSSSAAILSSLPSSTATAAESWSRVPASPW